MTRLQPVDRTTADAGTTALLDTVQKQMGGVPNLISSMAASRSVAEAYLGFSRALAGGALTARVREQIALVVAETNRCDYCLAAHTTLGKSAGLTEAETRDARRAEPADTKEKAAVTFARQIVEDRGMISDDDLQSVRDAGYSDGEIGEITANVALNLFTNYFNHVAGTEIDFPAAPDLQTAAA